MLRRRCCLLAVALFVADVAVPFVNSYAHIRNSLV
jgi:hypothetical protein